MKRELSVGDTLNEVFRTYGEHAGVLLPVAFWLFLVVAIVDGITGSDVSAAPIVFALSAIVGTLYQGMVVGLVRDVQDGKRDSSVGELFGFAAPVLLPLFGAGLLYAIGVGVGLVLLFIPGFYLMAIWAVIAPAIVIERKGVFDAFGRSRELVRGQGMPVFWVVIIGVLISLAGALVLGQIAISISDGPIVRAVFSALASTVTAPITALVAAILYYRLLAIEGTRATAPAPGPAEPGDTGSIPPPTPGT
jgi:hypothetical protein